jgi:translation initiation factor IF-3
VASWTTELAVSKGGSVIRKYAFREDPEKPQVRINERVRLSPVRLIDEEGNQVGVVAVDEALRLARSKGLDLVEVSAASRPIVCKIMDYGRFRYEQEKKAREEKKKQHQVDLKEVKLRPNINSHDLETKLRRARDFLEQGKHVKVTIMFRMREMRRPENGYVLLAKVREELADVARVDREPSRELEGRDLTMVMRPLRRSAGSREPRDSRDQQASAPEPAGAGQ